MTNQAFPHTYDSVPYVSLAIQQSHPQRLAAIGTLLGMQPADVRHCRLLEIGCAAGGNILPMAEQFPDSEFVGIDLSEVQIEQGEQVRQSIGLTNIRLECDDVCRLTEARGSFDYILAHGVYSWVPQVVQQAILDTCRRLLTKHGIAFVSYNTYPGWHMRGMVREMMAYRAGKFDHPEDKVRQARDMLRFLARAARKRGDAYGLVLEREQANLEGKPDFYLLHEHLDASNQPVYFHQFVERLRGSHLQYLSDAIFAMTGLASYGPEANACLDSLASDRLEREQLMDFVRNRHFRNSLICHADIQLEMEPKAKYLCDLHVVFAAAPEPLDEDGQPNRVLSLSVDKKTLSCDDPPSMEALRYLKEMWPKSVWFGELVSVALERCTRAGYQKGSSEGSFADQIGATVLLAFRSGMVQLSSIPLAFVTEPSDYPATTRLALYCASIGDIVPNRKHAAVQLDPISRWLLSLLDGSQHVDQLAQGLAKSIASGEFRLDQNGVSPSDPESIRSLAQALTGQLLRSLGQSSLLVA